MLRGFSMNATMGFCTASGRYSALPADWGIGRLFKNQSRLGAISRPAQFLVVMDEDANSINDALLRLDYSSTAAGFRLNDIPALYHGGASGISFADGHSELHKWRTLRVPVPNWVSPGTGASGWGANNPVDAQWLLEHVGEP
jgi:prepilin-type processing-associated H-X9-DG protein